YLMSNKDRDLEAFAREQIGPDRMAKPIEVLAAREDAELEDFEVNDQGTMAVLMWNVAGKTEVSFFDLVSGKNSPGPELPTELAFDQTFSHDGKRLAFVMAGAAAPPDIWVMDLASRKFTQLTFSQHAGVDLKELIRPQLVRYPAHDGLSLSAWLY